MTADETLPNDIPSEITEAQKLVPSMQVITSTPHFVSATYERTPYTRIKILLTFPEEYPAHPLIVDIDQDKVVPPGLKKKLEKELGQLAAERAGRHDQVRAVWERLVAFVDTNLFVPCWKELKKCVDLVQNSNKQGDDGNASSSLNRFSSASKCSTISIIESKGKIKLSLHNKSYHYNCTITICPSYPDYSPVTQGKACLLQVQSTNFPSPIEHMLTTQAQEIVKRMQDGLPPERALHMSNPIRLPKNFHLNVEEAKADGGRLTQETIMDLKHDTETLKRVTDLRHAESAAGHTNDGGATSGGYQNHKALAKERKDARRTIQKITLSEREHDKSLEEKERAWKLEEKKRLTGYYELYNVQEGGTIEPQPSLFVLVTFLVEKIQGLVEEICPCCEERVLPVDPTELNAMYGGTSHNDNNGKKSAANHHPKHTKKKKPMRTYCGCWYHKCCLNTLLTEPPFGLSCPNKNCGQRVFHPDWPSDIKQLEREWAAKQARKREIEDAMMFL
ncbi:hypothetical protein ACHAXS_008617 [Conticribra weissflogii]